MANEIQLFPAALMENSAELHFQRYDPRTLLIYRIAIVIVLLAFLAIVLIPVNVSVRGTGVVKSPTEHNSIKALVSGTVGQVMMKENGRVKAGQVLLTINADMIREESNYTTAQLKQFEDEAADLEKLTQAAQKHDLNALSGLKSGLYGQQLIVFKQRLREASARYYAAKRNYDRYRSLKQAKVISAAEYDMAELAYRNVQNDVQLIYDEQGSAWQAELTGLRMKISELRSKNVHIRQQQDFYTLRAPVSGTVQEMKGVQPGSAISANEILAEISPDSGLIVETYVPPHDIGLLKVGTTARFQVDAYNYNQWGMLNGKVISVSNDSYSNNQQLFFKVRCRVDRDHLTLKNGYTGKLKKGMTVQAVFQVTQRTVFQLLYDKADDWLNPNRSEAVAKG
jgi:membrane fusion protein, peptide pheromone/bacteriocin exporter